MQIREVYPENKLPAMNPPGRNEILSRHLLDFIGNKNFQPRSALRKSFLCSAWTKKLFRIRRVVMKRAIEWAQTHPRLTAWLVLALGMDGMVAYEARTVGLQPGQWVALIVATTLVAGLCVWIIGWEDDAPDEAGEEQPAQTKK